MSLLVNNIVRGRFKRTLGIGDLKRPLAEIAWESGPTSFVTSSASLLTARRRATCGSSSGSMTLTTLWHKKHTIVLVNTSRIEHHEGGVARLLTPFLVLGDSGQRAKGIQNETLTSNQEKIKPTHTIESTCVACEPKYHVSDRNCRRIQR